MSMQVLPFSYWYVPFTHIMSRKFRKLQLRALVGRFGSQNALVGRLDDLGAGVHTAMDLFCVWKSAILKHTAQQCDLEVS